MAAAAAPDAAPYSSAAVFPGARAVHEAVVAGWACATAVTLLGLRHYRQELDRTRRATLGGGVAAFGGCSTSATCSSATSANSWKDSDGSKESKAELRSGYLPAPCGRRGEPGRTG